MDDYELECHYEALNFTPTPSTEIEFEKILIKFDGESSSFLSKKFLIKLSSIRKELATDITQAPNYLKHLYPLYIILINDRASYRTRGIPEFTWTTCNSETITSSCWRFEFIMAGYAAALQHLATSCKSQDAKSRLTETLQAYTIFRYLCLEEVERWTRIDISKLPLECSEHCCRFFASLCLCIMQRIAISHNELDGWVNWTTPLKLCLWLFEETKILTTFAKTRIDDGSGNFLRELHYHMLPILTNDAAVLVHAYSAKIFISEKKELSYAKAYKLTEYAEGFCKYNTSQLVKHRCLRHDESAKRLADFLKSIKRDCDIASSANLAVASHISNLNLSEAKDPNLVWTLVPTKETKFYRDLKKIPRYITDEHIWRSMFYGLQY